MSRFEAFYRHFHRKENKLHEDIREPTRWNKAPIQVSTSIEPGICFTRGRVSQNDSAF